MADQIGGWEMRPKRRMRHKSRSPVVDRRSLADRSGFALLVRRQTGLSSACQVSVGDVPYVIRPPCPLAGDSLGLVSGGVVFPELSKLLHQEDALGAPCLDTVMLALRRRALAGRSTASRDRRMTADRRNPSLRYHITVCYTGHQAGKR